MHILILGAGALGSLLGARLSRTDSRVTMLSTNREHIRAIRERGLLVEELDGTIQRFDVVSHDDPGEIADPVDVVIVLVKLYDTLRAVPTIRSCCHSKTFFLTLQNGIGNWERIAGLVGLGRVLVGSTAQGSTLVEPGRVRHGGNGPTHIGEPKAPPSERVYRIVEVFQKAQLKTEASDRMEQLIWEKLHVNVGINAITALTNIRNGLVAEVPMARDLCRSAVQEAMKIASAKGFTIQENMVERVLSVARATAVNRSSMGQDVDRRKRTEIDGINGAVVEFGKETGIPVPVNETLTRLVKILEAGYLQDRP